MHTEETHLAGEYDEGGRGGGRNEGGRDESRPYKSSATEENVQTAHRGTVLEVLGVFAKLGVSSFGGPVAHLGYFRQEIVVRRKWVDEAAYADIIGLSQFLPGPSSSQTAPGLSRCISPSRRTRARCARWSG